MFINSEGKRGDGSPGKKGAEGVRGGMGVEGSGTGFPRCREAGETGAIYATLRNISQSRKRK